MQLNCKRYRFVLGCFSLLWLSLICTGLQASSEEEIINKLPLTGYEHQITQKEMMKDFLEVGKSGKLSLPKLYEKLSPYVVKVKCLVDGSSKLVSGFFVSQEGHVLAPILNGKDFYVETVHGQVFKAEKLGEDSVTSICLLKTKLTKQTVPYFSLVRSICQLSIGQTVVSLSCKLGLNVSPQLGYITGFNDRYFKFEWPMTFVRTSLRIDGGDCGGAVLDEQGSFLGMLLHALQDSQETFFMPVTGLYKIFQDLLLHGRVRYGFVGVNTQVVFDNKYKRTCLQVVKVHALSPAEKAGLKEGDILLAVNDSDIDSIGNFKDSMFLSNPGDIIFIKYLRDDKECVVRLEIGEKS